MSNVAPLLHANLAEAEAKTPGWSLPHCWRSRLNTLRMIALGCRVAPRDDLFRACALLATERSVAQDAYARALFRCLQQAIGKQPVFYRPGENELSFDEAWLMQLLIAMADGEGDSVAFLIRSRVPQPHQRQVAFLAKGITKQFLE